MACDRRTSHPSIEARLTYVGFADCNGYLFVNRFEAIELSKIDFAPPLLD